jgi:glyceraldehyde-3-phosphate dehydrogenase/erythrose-4-phosphate dehydrogenase
LGDNNLRPLTPDNLVLREAQRDGMFVYVPTSNAMAIVLQHRLDKEPTLNELEDLLKTKRI